MGLSGLSIFDKFVELFKSSPATRTYEMQNIFKGLIESQEKDIIFILEDIDRSGDGGIYFLETLRQFIHSLDSKKLIIAIVPIGSINYEKNNSSYLKCLDYVERLSISHNSFEKFVNEIFKDELFVENILDESKRIIFTASKMKTQTASFLRALYKSEYNINIRLMKQIIRKADKTYLAQIKDGHKPDWRVTLCIEATKNSFAKKGDQFFERIKNSNSILESSIFAKFISTMIEDRESMYSSNDDLIQYRKDIIIVHQNGISFPEYPYRCEIDFEKNGYAINSFYLEY
jgi:hypothetical protein